VQASGAVPAARRIVVALLTGLVRMWHCGGGRGRWLRAKPTVTLVQDDLHHRLRPAETSRMASLTVIPVLLSSG
jgi:hypothetical protein